MARFVLDTNACIQIMRGRGEPFRSRLTQVSSNDLALCSIVWAELLLGARLSPRSYDQERAKLEPFLRLTQFPFDQAAAGHYADIRAHLQSVGQLIGERDLQIAAITRGNYPLLRRILASKSNANLPFPTAPTDQAGF